MTSTPCAICERPTPDGYTCHADALSLAQSLQDAAGYAEDAEAVIARQTRYGAGSRGRSGEGQTPDMRTSEQLTTITLTISRWAHIITKQTRRQPHWRPMAGPQCPPVRPGDEPRKGNRCDHNSCAAIRRREHPNTLAINAAWLGQRQQIDWLRKHPAAAEAFNELHDACDQLARLVDRPADKDLVGMCDCGKVLYARPGQAVVTCPQPTCRLPWDVARSRDILRDALRVKLFSAAECARLAAFWSDRTQPR